MLLYGSGFAGYPFVPINYRLADEQLRDILARTAPSVVVVEDAVPARVGSIDGVELVTRAQFLRALDELAGQDITPSGSLSPDDIAILLFTSGTTGDPKAAVLRHRHLASYLITSLEFGSAGDDEATVVSVPPYHIA